jgi:hypothetical protein
MKYVETLFRGATVAVLAATAQGQSINIDFGDGHGSPDPTYAAGGLPGVWNTLTGPIDTPTPLVALDGSPTAITITVAGAGDTFVNIPVAHPDIGEHRAFFDDSLLGAHGPEFPVDIRIDGLANGTYRLLSYYWHWPSELYAQVAFVESSPFVYSAGGPWPGGPVVGVTHMAHVVKVTTGMIELEVVGDGPGAFWNGSISLNGLQIWKIDEPPPCPADVDGDGVVSVTDLTTVILGWGECAEECPGDVDGSGNVDVEDLVAVLLAWGDCPELEPVACGDPGLADCYEAHGSPGCDEPACCDAVCGLDPYCCEQSWDDTCVGVANLVGDCAAAVHPNCGNAEAGGCDQAGVVPGCDDSDCCQVVCATDAYCCRYGWDAYCVGLARELCSE